MTTQDLTVIANKIIDLKKFQESTGFVTGRSRGELIKDLNAEQLAIVAGIVNKALEAR